MSAIGLADACELMSAAFAFPTEELAAALRDGTFRSDALSCLSDAGACGAADDDASAARAAAGDADVDRGAAGEADVDRVLGDMESKGDSLFSDLRKGYTLLYLKPAPDTVVWPYEAAFCATRTEGADAPSLFRSPCQIDVERHMAEAGVRPKRARQEPADSVWDEFSFLSFCYGSAAAALHEGRLDDAPLWYDRVDGFWDEHASRWLPDFMRKTMDEAPKQLFGEEYVALAILGLRVLDAIAFDVEARRS